MRWQVNEWTSCCELCLVSIDLKLNVVAVVADTRALQCSLNRRLALYLSLLVEVTLHYLFRLRRLLHDIQFLRLLVL